MKKLLILILIMSLTLFIGCGQKVDNENLPESDHISTDNGLTEDDLVFAVEGTSFPLNSDAALLLEAFGPDYIENTAPSCVYEGEDKSFIYDFAEIYTYPLEGKDQIDEIYILDGEYQTNKGIKIGSTLEDVKTKYGENGFDQEGTYVYVLSGDITDLKSPKLFFDITDGIVTGFSYYAASNVVE